MNAATRHAWICQALTESPQISVSTISTALGVSAMTVRRDIAALERAGLVRRVHGGAATVERASYEPPFEQRIERFPEAKAAIADRALDLLEGIDAFVVDGGSTGLALALALPSLPNAIVCTPSLRVASVLMDKGYREVMIPGGVLRPGERSLVGALSERTFDEYNFDLAFVTCSGLSVERGVTEWNTEDSRVKASILRSSRRAILLADSTKIGQTAFAKVAALDSFELLITDARATESQIQQLHRAGLPSRVVQLDG